LQIAGTSDPAGGTEIGTGTSLGFLALSPKKPEYIKTARDRGGLRNTGKMLEQLARALIDRAVADRFLPFEPDFTAEDYLAVRDLMLERMIADGEILPGQKVRFCRWQTADECTAYSRAAEEAAKWSPVSEEASVVEPMSVELSVEDRLADAEMRRKFNRPIDEIIPLPEGIV
jgi:hypothetical protein